MEIDTNEKLIPFDTVSGINLQESQSLKDATPSELQTSTTVKSQIAPSYSGLELTAVKMNWQQISSLAQSGALSNQTGSSQTSTISAASSNEDSQEYMKD